MTSTQVTIVGALLASPLLISVFDWIRNKIGARFIYHGWQAVFLTNGQVYFGKIISTNKTSISLQNIFYIQDDGKAHYPGKIGEDESYILVKLGQELHGPEDLMIINVQEISFIENLKDSGEVVKKIKEYYQDQAITGSGHRQKQMKIG